MATKETQKIPGFSQGVRLNSAMRMVKLIAPICPNSQPKFEKNAEGKRVPAEHVEQNCQLAGGQWWVDCEARGHDPYFTTRVWYTVEDVYEEDDQGRSVLRGQQRIRHEERRPNVVQVPLSRRMHSGNGVKNSMERKGRRRLADFGYAEVCQFRNCQNEVNPKYLTPAYGGYCSYDHLSLIAADAQEVMLPQINGVTEGPRIGQIRSKREKMLREATIPHMEQR